jgi:hypothetical protein
MRQEWLSNMDSAIDTVGRKEPWAHDERSQRLFNLQLERMTGALAALEAMGTILLVDRSDIKPGRKRTPGTEIKFGSGKLYEFNEGDTTLGGLQELAYVEFTLHRRGCDPVVVTLSHHPMCDTYFEGAAVASVAGKRIDISGTWNRHPLRLKNPSTENLETFLKYLNRVLAKSGPGAVPAPEAVAV